nr:unnamed protein product [Spirometra erinaceieuropaei]
MFSAGKCLHLPQYLEVTGMVRSLLDSLRLFARIGLVGHLKTQCNNNRLNRHPCVPTSTASTIKAFPPDAPPQSITATPIIPASTTARTATTTSPPTPATFQTPATTSNVDCVPTCPHCNRTFTYVSAWSVNCKSIALRLAHQFQEFPHTRVTSD